MEHFLVALDTTPGSAQKILQYVNRVLRGADHVTLILFHVIPATSPNLLKREEVDRIEEMHEDQPHLSGYYWDAAYEEKMTNLFQEGRAMLIEGGFAETQVKTHFSVESTEIAYLILQEARTLHCSTIVLGRRGLGRVKEFFLGSVSNTVTKQARDTTVWVVDS